MKALLPTKGQWSRWSLPSRLTAIGVLLGAIGLLYAVLADLGSAFVRRSPDENQSPATIVGSIEGPPGEVSIVIDNRPETLVLAHKSGFFRIENLRPGKHLIEAAFSGYKSKALVIEIAPGTNTVAMPPLERMSILDFPKVRTHLALRNLYAWESSDFLNGADVYATISIDDQELITTPTLRVDEGFKFHYEFPSTMFTVSLPAPRGEKEGWKVRIRLWDEDLFSDDLLGSFRLDVATTDPGNEIPLLRSEPTEDFPQGNLALQVEFLSERVIKL